MADAKLDERGRLTVPKELRERYGDRYHIVEIHDGIKLIPVSEEPLAELREEFEGLELSSEELRDRGRESGVDEAGR